MSHTFDPKLTRPKLATIAANARRNHATDAEIESLWEAGLAFIAKRKSDNARRKQLTNLWYVHLVPLQAERKRVVASLAYPTHNRNNADPRQMALKAYKKVLDELLSRFKREASGVPLSTRPTMTPPQYVKAKNVPNNGEHWTDYVPSHIKQRIVEMFDAIPHTPKARRKIPFERVIGEDLHKERKERLIRRTEKELIKCKQDLLINPNDDHMRDRVARMEEALDKIEQLDENEPVPTTWHGLY